MKIKKLNTETINLISAGEVIESPADVVKELLENSIDAGATEIELTIQKAGIDLIDIKDNGSGIEKNDLTICLNKYTTSKLEKIDDIYSIKSFGFRGEALSSIDAISKLKIITSTTNDGVGYFLEDKKIGEIASTKGTRIIIKDLFYNIPVRKKFLKSTSFEFTRLYDNFVASVLLNPNITFKFHSERKNMVFQKTTFENRFVQVFGIDIKSKTIPINITNELFTVKGVLGKPNTQIYFPTNYLFINRRYVYSTKIIKAISDSYKDYLMIQQKPFFTLFITLNPETIDVNVHPKKKFIKLQNEMLILSELKKELTNILNKSLGKVAPDVSGSIADFIKPKSNTFNFSNSGFSKNTFLNRQPASINNPNINYQTTDFSSQKYFTKNEGSEPIKLLNKTITRFVGQIHNTFILCETNDGVFIIDQHAAAERINLEKNRKEFANNFKKQQLINKQKLNLTPAQIEILTKNKELINKMGFDYIVEDDLYYMTAVPLFLNRYFDENIFSNLLVDLQNGTHEVFTLQDHLIKLKSCKQSIKANDSLTIPEQIELVKELDKCDDKTICAHGRPSTIFLSIKDFEKLFKRIV